MKISSFILFYDLIQILLFIEIVFLSIISYIFFHLWHLDIIILGVVGRDYYGVFPLKGKLLNVREALHAQIMKNEEVQNIAKILGYVLSFHSYFFELIYFKKKYSFPLLLYRSSTKIILFMFLLSECIYFMSKNSQILFYFIDWFHDFIVF